MRNSSLLFVLFSRANIRRLYSVHSLCRPGLTPVLLPALAPHFLKTHVADKNYFLFEFSMTCFLTIKVIPHVMK